MSTERPQKRRLYRSRDDKVIAGVCGGIGDYFNVDPVWIRVVFLVLLIANGAGLLLYIIMWIVVPRTPLSLP